jgi:hypothetical protein
MKYALGNMLNGANVRGLDPNAKSYIDAVVAAGATVTSTQRNAINAFVKGGKTDGWWSSMKRIHLPIWAIAAPNAIDMVGLTSGTFNGTVTHSAGYIAGDGSTGFFAIDATNSVLGLVPSTGSMFALRTNIDPLKRIMGTLTPGTGRTFLGTSAGNAQGEYIGSSGVFLGPASSGTQGIILTSRISGSTTTYHRTSSIQNTNTSTYSDTGVSATSVMHVMSFNGSTAGRDASRYGFFGCGLGLNTSQSTSFTAAIKTLWETCTGLSI